MGAMTDSDDLTVGQVAELLGVTVRTLHHYEAVGVAGASHRTWSGYRLYSPRDVARLERVVFLRRNAELFAVKTTVKLQNLKVTMINERE